MNLTTILPQDELVLARLTVAKLAKVVHGLLSTGTACLALPSPETFLTGREKTPLGFLEVLGCIGVNPGHADKIPMLRERVKELSELVSQSHRELLELAVWRTLSSENIHHIVGQLSDTYTQFCQKLQAFGTMLEMDVNYSKQAQEDVQMLEAFFVNSASRYANDMQPSLVQ
jgi:hypothetical protein